MTDRAIRLLLARQLLGDMADELPREIVDALVDDVAEWGRGASDKWTRIRTAIVVGWDRIAECEKRAEREHD